MLVLKTRMAALAALVGLALAACSGGAEVASPGEGVFNNPGGGGGGSTPLPPGTPAADCPAGFSNVGTAAAGTLRNCQLPALVTGNLVVPLRAGTIYSVSGRVDVGQDRGPDANAPIAGAAQGILTVEPGVRIFGSAGLDYIVVNRGSQIFAEGTATQPIEFTSRSDVDGTDGVDSIGQWGGIVILGRAPINHCTAPAAVPGTNACVQQVEGTNAFYGGSNPSDNSGILRYVRVKYTGFVIVAGNELNGIGLAGVGSGTTVDFVQVHNSSDDGIEIWGGNVTVRHLVLTGNDDDSFDTDSGWQGGAQFLIVAHRSGGGDRAFEMSGAPGAPHPAGDANARKSQPRVSNFTIITPRAADTIIMNSGTDSRLVNGVIRTTNASSSCFDLDVSGGSPSFSDPSTTGFFRSLFLSCGGGAEEADGQLDGSATTLLNAAGSNNVLNGTSSLTNFVVNGANETAVPVFALSPTPAQLSGVTWTNVTYIGAVQNAADSWWQGWTCSELLGRPAC